MRWNQERVLKFKSPPALINDNELKYCNKMKLLNYLLCLFVVFSTMNVLHAASDDDVKSNSILNGIWTAKITSSPGGSICVPVRTISSVTIHYYLLNGKIPIAELTIDTLGNNSIRLYALLSPSSDSIGLTTVLSAATNEVASMAGLPKVGKKYPETTHAHSVEYSISSESQLKVAYDSLLKCLATNTGASISIK